MARRPNPRSNSLPNLLSHRAGQSLSSGNVKPPDAMCVKEKSIPCEAPSSSSQVMSSSSRLPSFRAPRDLTLSAPNLMTSLLKPGMGRARKNFVPNIPTRREKGGTVIESKSTKGVKTPSREKSPRGQGRGRGRGREYVQMQGALFGEGIAATTSSRGGLRSHSSSGGASEACLQKPVLKPDAVYKVDKEHEEQKLKEILRDDFIDDSEMLLEAEPDVYPVQLPMGSSRRIYKQEEDEEGRQSRMKVITQEMKAVRVKEEPKDDDFGMKIPDIKNAHLPLASCQTTGSRREHIPEKSVAEILAHPSSDVIFLQLPNSLPSQTVQVKQEKDPEPSTSKGSQNPSNTAAQSDGITTLEDIPEGRIGTMKVYQSGKVELWLGNHMFLVNKGTQVGFLQDVVCVDINEKQQTGSMTVLGHIQHRLVCTPDFEAMVLKKGS